MSDINQIIAVTVTRENAKVTRAGFGTPLIVGVNGAFVERVRTYLNITAVSADFAATTEEYLMAAMVFGQSASPVSVKIGRRVASAAQSNDVTIAGTVLDMLTAAKIHAGFGRQLYHRSGSNRSASA